MLGAGATDAGVFPVFRERINHAIRLYENGFVDYLIFTGGTGDSNTKSDALIAKDYGIAGYSSPTPTSMYKSLQTQLPFLIREKFFYIGYCIVRLFK